MCKFNPKNDSRRIDSCMRSLIMYLKFFGAKTLSCCCGHGKYPMTIVCDFEGYKKEIISNIEIPRKKKFYKKDSEGYYFIPEIIDKRTGDLE